jgi:hypothetical protein
MLGLRRFRASGSLRVGRLIDLATKSIEGSLSGLRCFSDAALSCYRHISNV